LPVNRFSRSKKLVKQGSANGSAKTRAPMPIATGFSGEAELPTRPPARRLSFSSRSHGASLRPAQLETAGNEQVNRRAFHTQKKILDAVYRRTGKAQPSLLSTRLEHAFQGQVPKPPSSPFLDTECDIPESSHNTEKPRARRRKLLRPRYIDTAAPQYVHRDDPLPEELERVSVPEPLGLSSAQDNKLLGLQPYGFHYTQHFEVFPLDGGIFFHESTLIGQGKIMKAFGDAWLQDINRSRGSCALLLGDQLLTWGTWNAQTSSEFGVLFDWIADQVQNNSALGGNNTTTILTATQAMDFSVDFLLETVTLPDTESSRLFVHRILEVISGFLDRLVSATTVLGPDIRQLIEILTRCLLIVLYTLRICVKLSLTESLRVEDLMRKTAKQTVRALLRIGPLEMACCLDQLREPGIKSYGIRKENHVALGWVTLIRVLQDSQIPRSSFWEVTSPVMLESGSSSPLDVRRLEKLWHTLFLILPLGEFDNTGLVVTGLRNRFPLESWILPQKLLNRVFELYKANQRQSPSFNDYCRALVSRCHYLVEQWGWRKCSSIVGSIFDFFAAQNLSHLRNEEVYRSPQFLENLADSPSLAVQAEDRCFHIFLKLLALSIQRLRKHGLIRDVKNLIARVLPNHNRQYLKESEIHENDLASLRNHHDLLCTLFWCSPQALRPSVHMLEKLVIPGSSHKEACLINLRAWNQLARFVVSSGEDRTVVKPLADWQNNVFKQVLEQYSSVESDIQQQFLRMSKDASNGVSSELMERIINMNKQAATDVLHFSLRANLDVMRHAQSLAAVSFVLNTCE
jgi:hypothetical protein